MQRKRLVWQLYPSYLVIVLAALVAVAWFASHALKQAHLGSVADRLESTARLVDSNLGSAALEQPAGELQAIAGGVAQATGERVTLVATDGRVLADTQEDPAKMENHRDRAEIAGALQGELGEGPHYSYTLGRRMSYVAVPLVRDGKVVGVVRTARAISEIDAAVRALQSRVLASAALAAVLAALASYGLARWISRPVEELRDGAVRLLNGGSVHKLTAPDGDELATITDVLNQMAHQLEERSHTIGRKGYEQQAVLASMVEGVLAVDSDEKVISLNKAAAELIGGQHGDLFGRSLQEVVRNADLRRFASRALVCDEPIEDDVVLHGDSDRVLRARGTALRDARGAGVGAVIVLNDVTHFRHLESLRRDFVANVSHELKTPIASIKGFVETLLDGAIHQPEDAERFLRIVAKQGDRLNSIIEDLLSLSKIEQSEEAADLVVENGRIQEVVEAAVSDCQSQATERNVQVTINCPADLHAMINAALLEQAIINLIDNAIKYSDPGSGITIEVTTANAEVAISVIDHGCGVEKEHLPRLFERFYRVDKARSRKLGGTGLGLAIVKHIVQAHHGRITVRSQPGRGSTFTIYLPLRSG